VTVVPVTTFWAASYLLLSKTVGPNPLKSAGLFSLIEFRIRAQSVSKHCDISNILLYTNTPHIPAQHTVSLHRQTRFILNKWDKPACPFTIMFFFIDISKDKGLQHGTSLYKVCIFHVPTNSWNEVLMSLVYHC